MDEYKIPYLILWKGCTAAMEAIEQQNFGLARQLLLHAQQNAEEHYVNEAPASP